MKRRVLCENRMKNSKGKLVKSATKVGRLHWFSVVHTHVHGYKRLLQFYLIFVQGQRHDLSKSKNG